MPNEELQQAITWFENRLSAAVMPGAREMFGIALSALREKQERDNPKPLTLDELREMGGEPAYFQFGDGVQGWAVIEWQTESGIILYGPVADDHSEPDVDFINMEYDDPDGYFGLHLLGWRAYRYKPEEAQDER